MMRAKFWEVRMLLTDRPQGEEIYLSRQVIGLIVDRVQIEMYAGVTVKLISARNITKKSEELRIIRSEMRDDEE